MRIGAVEYGVGRVVEDNKSAINPNDQQRVIGAADGVARYGQEHVVTAYAHCREQLHLGQRDILAIAARQRHRQARARPIVGKPKQLTVFDILNLAINPAVDGLNGF